MPRGTARGLLALTAGLLLLTSGCAKPTPKVAIQGQITNKGRPVTTSNRGFVQLTFHPADSDGKPVSAIPAVVDSQKGTYEVGAIPVGKYKVVVQQMDPAPVTDKLKGAFSLANTRIIREVTTDGTLDIDLARP